MWKHTDGTVFGWLMNGVVVSSGAQLLPANSGFVITHTLDVDGDGKADLLWKHTDGRVFVWLMNGLTQAAGNQLLGAGTGWSVGP